MADIEEITLNGKPLSKLRVVDLKQELDQRGLSKAGSKVELMERLRAVNSAINAFVIDTLLSTVKNRGTSFGPS